MGAVADRSMGEKLAKQLLLRFVRKLALWAKSNRINEEIVMRVLVCGGRNYSDRDNIHNTLCDLDIDLGPITCVIHGCATGADHEGMIWAQMMAESGRKITHAPFEADWQRFGRAAGPKRNQRMIDEGRPDLVVAFPGGKGTADMVSRARDAGIKVMYVHAITHAQGKEPKS